MVKEFIKQSTDPDTKVVEDRESLFLTDIDNGNPVSGFYNGNINRGGNPSEVYCIECMFSIIQNTHDVLSPEVPSRFQPLEEYIYMQILEKEERAFKCDECNEKIQVLNIGTLDKDIQDKLF